SFYYTPNDSGALWFWLSNILQQYADERDDYWQEKLDQQEWSVSVQLLRDADSMADSIRRAALVLKYDPDDENQHAIFQMFELAPQRKEEWENTLRRVKETIYKTLPPAQADQAWKNMSSMAKSMDFEEEAYGLVCEKLEITETENALNGISQRVRRICTLETLV